MTSSRQQTFETHPPFAVVGAGVIGVAIAFELQAAGNDVVLIDAAEPGRGASFGNMGSIAVSEFAPISRPSIWRRIPAWMIDPEGPIRVRPSYAPRAIPWFLRFLRAGLPDRLGGLEAAGAALCGRALMDTQDLLLRIGASALLSEEGCLALYASQAEFDADLEHRALMQRFQISHRHLNKSDLHDLEPEIASGIARGILIPDARTVADPYQVVLALFEAFLKRGGRFERLQVERLSRETGRIDAVLGQGRKIAVSGAVIAAGARTGLISAAQGDNIPLETERGYHTQITSPGIGLRHAIISPAKAFMVTPVANGLRVGGTVELAGLEAAPDFRRAKMTLKQAQALLPNLKTHCVTEWMGHRPALPDTVPVISRSLRVHNLFYATGHGHLGLTLAATTARLMQDLVAGHAPRIDVAPYRVDRF